MQAGPTFAEPNYEQHTAISPFVQGELEPVAEESQERGAYVPDLQAIPEVEESHRERRLRKLGNVCELAAGAAGGSSVVFFFAALNIPPLGIMLALGITHLYLTATIAGEGKDRAIVNVMSATGTGASALTAASEPLADAWQARGSQAAAMRIHKAAYNPSVSLLDRLGEVGGRDIGEIGSIELLGSVALAIILILMTRR